MCCAAISAASLDAGWLWWFKTFFLQVHNVGTCYIDDFQPSAAPTSPPPRPPRHPTRPDLDTEYASAHSLSMVISMLALCRTTKNLSLRKTGKPFVSYDFISIFFCLYPLPRPVPSFQAQTSYTGLILSQLRLRMMARYAHCERAVSLSSDDFFRTPSRARPAVLSRDAVT
ncbi:hypothetical protein OE88DRAFT_1668474 [Heliocybe sulcata]|uniref:Uncharacterized protein n=1 Tax=Heliocybe sulcata TaxID=5364 RepID=A0A5C3MKG2_9AGAM|nr:hypothetical protein OE88DRAFT_1668474 [Heliocybe sulcata]